MNQLLLFKDRPDLVDAFNKMDVKAMVQESTPIARRSDPITSHQSAAETESKLSTIKAVVLDILQMTPEPMTAQEAALESVKIYGGMTETYRKRCHELVKDGHATECGFRACQITGKNAQTFKAKGSK